MKFFLSEGELKKHFPLITLIKYLNLPLERGNKIKSIFNDERTASLLINTDGLYKNKFKDFSSGKPVGNIIEFYIQYQKKDGRIISKEIAINELNKIRKEISMKSNFENKIKAGEEKKTQRIFKYDLEMNEFKRLLKIYADQKKGSKNEIITIVRDRVMQKRKERHYRGVSYFLNQCDEIAKNKTALNYLTGVERNLSLIEIEKFKLKVLTSSEKMKRKLLSRFSNEDLEIFGLFRKDKFVYKDNHIIIPFYKDNKIISLSARSINNNKKIGGHNYTRLFDNTKDTKDNQIFNIDILKKLKQGDRIYITESEFDCMVMTRFKENCIGFRGVSNISLSLIKELNSKYDVVLAFDNDKESKAGINAVKKVANYLQEPVKHLKLKYCKDITELWGKSNRPLNENKYVVEKIMRPMLMKNEVNKPFNINNKMSAKDLQKIYFEEDYWYADKLIKAGLTLISGRPKTGKSIFTLNMAVCIAKGRPFMNKYLTRQTGVYYISFEEGLRLLQKRMDKMLSGQKFPDNLVFPIVSNNIDGIETKQVSFPKFDDGGLQYLENFILSNKDVKVIIFDNIGKAYANRSSKNGFEEDYKILAPLRELAIKYSICIIGIHHTRKMFAQNPIDELMGSSSLVAVADSLIVMRNVNTNLRTIYITGRDIETREINAEMNIENYSWKEVKIDYSQRLTPEQYSVFEIFEKCKNRIISNKQVTIITKLSKESVSRIFKVLTQKRLIKKVTYGKYKLVA